MPVANHIGMRTIADEHIERKLSVARGRAIPPVLEEIEELKKKKVHVFNVGPWPLLINTGSTGSFLIPGCPEGTDYVELLVQDASGEQVPPISYIMDELYPQSEDEYRRLQERGKDFALSMIGIGRGQSPSNALTHQGVFVAAGEKPTASELDEANKLLWAYCEGLVRQIADIYATDRKAFSLIVRPKVHFVAAHVLNLDNEVDSPWMVKAAPKGRTKCKMCGRVVDPDVAMCEGGHIVNQELYIAAMVEQENVKAATQPKGK
jgi:hypothetical protein